VDGDDARISWFPVPDDDALPEDLAKLFAKATDALGFVPNVFRAYAWRPERFRPWFTHFKDLHVGSDHLSATEREMIAVVVSYTNRCLYCLVAHGATLRVLMDDPVAADRITFDFRKSDLDDRMRAVLEYAVKLTRDPTSCTEADLEVLRGHGLSDEEVWDVAEVTAMYNFTNRLASASGQLPNPEYSTLGR
jgi:uncharacterized peroxidase-related enzyme